MINKPYKAYAAATQTVAKTKQVVMLYDAAIKSAQHAREAIEQGDIQTRYNSLVKACDIIFGLQGSLDFENGGEVAQTLYDFYASADARLLSIHRSNDAALCEQVIKDLKLMRDAWLDIDKMDEEGALKSSSTSSASSPESTSPSEGGVAISA